MPRRIPRAFGRGYRKVASNPGVTLGLVIGLFVALAVVAVRSEDTRDVTNRIVQLSPCSADPASVECQRAKRESDREQSLRDACIPFRKVLTPGAFRLFTRCETAKREGVVPQTSGSSPTQQTGPSGGRSENGPVPGITEQPENGNKPAPATPNPTLPSPVPEPTVPQPAPTEPARPLIDLSPVTDPICETLRPVAAVC